MLKTMMLTSAIVVSVPALARQQSTPGREAMTTVPAAPQTAPTSTGSNAPMPQAPTTAVPGSPPAGTTVASAAPQPAPATPAEPVTGAAQIAQVVDTEFPAFDKNADTSLDRTEFAAWMVALKTASDPKTKADDPATVKWVSGAFVSADTDKSKTVSKAELTKYLSQGAE